MLALLLYHFADVLFLVLMALQLHHTNLPNYYWDIMS